MENLLISAGPFRHLARRIATLIFAGFFIGGISSAADNTPHKITAVDRSRIQVDSREWLELAGLNMTNLTSKKKSPSAFSSEIDSLLKSYVGKDVIVEEERQPRIGARGKSVYLYYLTPAASLPAGTRPGAAAKPVLLIDRVSGKGGNLRANMKPHMRLMINLELIGKGYARVAEDQNFKHKKDFLLAEKEAQIDRLGI